MHKKKIFLGTLAALSVPAAYLGVMLLSHKALVDLAMSRIQDHPLVHQRLGSVYCVDETTILMNMISVSLRNPEGETMIMRIKLKPLIVGFSIKWITLITQDGVEERLTDQ